MNNLLAGVLPGVAVSALLVLGPAQAAPTQSEVDRARGQCHALKLQVQRLEAGNVGDPAVSRERQRWESACAHANALMDERAGRGPARPADLAPMETAPVPSPMQDIEPEPDDVPDALPDEGEPAPLDIS